MDERRLLERIGANPKIFGGKPIIRGRRLAVEHVLGMLAAGDTLDDTLQAYPWLEREDIQACLVYARRTAANDRIEPLTIEAGPGSFSWTPASLRKPKLNWKLRAMMWSGQVTDPEDPGDETILSRAYEEQRVLVTLDKDFGALAVIRMSPHHGVLRLVDFRAGQQGAVCLRFLRKHASELAAGAIITAEPGILRIRQRQPPAS